MGISVTGVTLAAVAAIGMSLGVRTSPPRGVSATPRDSAEIRAAIERGARGFERGDPDSILAHYAPDIVLSYPGIPDQDYATLTRGYAELRRRPSSVRARTTPTFDEILVSGNLAIVRVRWTTTIDVAATDSAPARTSRRYLRDLQVWRRESNGAWRFIRGMHYPDSTAAPR